jgi:molybdopterin/thiamine biosynthesis adenylyltransferase
MERDVATSNPVLPRSLASSLGVAVVGTGSLGSAICRLLFLRGQAKVLLVDPDTVVPRNLALSRLFQQAGPHCVGRAKVEVVQGLARERGLDWQAIQAEIADVGLGRLAGYDVLVSCTDSALARVETAFAARSLRLPMLDGAVQSRHVPQGRVSWFAATEKAACYLCGLAENRRGELLAYALAPSLGCQPTVQADAMMAALDTVEAVAKTLVDLLEQTAPDDSFALRLRRPTEHTGCQTERIALTASRSCPWHALPPPDQLLSLPQDEPVHASLGPGNVLELPWPVCLRARCRRCGAVCEPGVRTARVRRALACPLCGVQGVLEPLHTLDQLTASDVLAAWTPRQLGLPPEHLYHRRLAIFATGEPEPDLS